MTGPILHIEHIAGRVRAWLDGREIPGVADVTSRHAAGSSPTVSVELIVSEVRHGAPPAGPRAVVELDVGRGYNAAGAWLDEFAKWNKPDGNVTRMNFSQALTRIKDGSKLTREWWNGPSQWVAMSPGFQLTEERVFSEPIRHALVADGEPGNFLPYLMIRRAQGDYVPWLPSQTDLLAEDWMVVS